MRKMSEYSANTVGFYLHSVNPRASEHGRRALIKSTLHCRTQRTDDYFPHVHPSRQIGLPFPYSISEQAYHAWIGVPSGHESTAFSVWFCGRVRDADQLHAQVWNGSTSSLAFSAPSVSKPDALEKRHDLATCPTDPKPFSTRSS